MAHMIFSIGQVVFLRVHSFGKEFVLEGTVFKKDGDYYHLSWDTQDDSWKSFPTRSIHYSHLFSDKASCIDAAIEKINKGREHLLREGSAWKEHSATIIADADSQVSQLEALRG